MPKKKDKFPELLKDMVGASFFNDPLADIVNKRYHTLSHEGYRPEINEGGDLVFKFEGKIYILSNDERDPNFFRLIFPNFFVASNPVQKELLEKTMNEVNAHIKMIKCYSTLGQNKNYASLAYEIYSDDDSLMQNVNRGIYMVQQGINYFSKTINRLS